MGDGKDKPTLQPPPRIPAANASDSESESAGVLQSPNPKRLAVQAVILAAMVLGLIGVFVLLPRWQEQRQNRSADGGEVDEIARPLEVPTLATQDPSPTDAMVVTQPSPPANPTRAPRPTTLRPRDTPQGQTTAADHQFVEAMSSGLAALENRQWLAAQDAFALASRLRPDAPEVADGLARARAGQRRETVADTLRRAADFEEREAWREAEKMYTAVLAIDPESASALDGRTRTQARADLDERLDFHLANPGRLSTASVFDDAAGTLEDAQETVPRGPRLEGQIARLQALLKHVSTPVAVVLESDASTEVVVYRVGRLGTFTRRQLHLKPGAYTVVGSRPGYRDVRLQLVVTPGEPPKPLVVRCTESL